MSTKSSQTASNMNPKSADGPLRSTMHSVVESNPVRTLLESAREYARANPEAAAFWCFGAGFVLAWRLKPW